MFLKNLDRAGLTALAGLGVRVGALQGEPQ